MPSETTSARAYPISCAPRGEVRARVRRLVVTAVIAGFAYSGLSTASYGSCLGGTSADGGFADRFGNPTDVVPTCIDMALRPSGALYLLLALIVLGAVVRALQYAHDEAAALRALDLAGAIVIVVALGAAAVAQASFFSISFDSWDGTSTPPIPRWISVDVVVSPMAV
ncbi:hypothetical protein [Georgenia thermotolerans]|uniref:Uncharacterized protein n=1 Tax=Georgenia thermotolerans TaxID=527326 RepID=A0A7J5UV21_9MICO|nr:hypothetical protein [Georgenia thermotolerans]KAE8766122.1 hypothetical protein GB883_00330 [Georgenia thermotolerans]